MMTFSTTWLPCTSPQIVRLTPFPVASALAAGFHRLRRSAALLSAVACTGLTVSGCEPGATLVVQNTTGDQLYVRDTIGVVAGVEPGETIEMVTFAANRRVARIKAHAYRAYLGQGNADRDAGRIAASGGEGMDDSNLVFCRDYEVSGPGDRVNVVIVAGDIACSDLEAPRDAATTP